MRKKEKMKFKISLVFQIKEEISSTYFRHRRTIKAFMLIQDILLLSFWLKYCNLMISLISFSKTEKKISRWVSGDINNFLEETRMITRKWLWSKTRKLSKSQLIWQTQLLCCQLVSQQEEKFVHIFNVLILIPMFKWTPNTRDGCVHSVTKELLMLWLIHFSNIFWTKWSHSEIKFQK
jgi:hypothetical protein